MRERKQLVIDYDAPLQWKLEALGLSKQAWYYTPQTKDDSVLLEHINTVLDEYQYYGYRRVTKELKDRGHTYNHKRILRIMGEYHLIQVPKRKATPRTTNSNHSLLVYPNAIKNKSALVPGYIWVSDITYIPVGQRWAYLAVVLDQGSRKVVGWDLSFSLHRSGALRALQMALGTHPAPKYHHSDRGVQYCSYDYIDLLKSNDITPSMADVGVSVDNPFAESFNRSLKVEEVYWNYYETLEDALCGIGSYLACYNATRLHSSLGYMSPEMFEARYYSTNS